MDPLIVLFGLGVGLLVGTTGVGGGSVMTPVLILAFGIKPVLAVGTDLAYGAITKTVGGWQHLRQGTVSMRIALWMAVGSIPGALGGVVLLDRLHDAYGDDIDSVVMAMVAGAVLLTAGLVFARTLFFPKLVQRERDQVDPFTLKHKLAAVGIGLSVGFVLGVTSVGSGALIAVGLILIYRLNPHRVVGTDIFHAALLLWVAGLAHVVSGNVDYALMGTILLGSVPGVYIGSRISGRLPAAGLRLALGTVLLAASLGLLTKAGLDIPAGAIVGLPVAIGIAAAFYLRRGRRVPRLITEPPTAR
ncbi:MAG: sulfite exporter TauE/SafE family protein [Solirubrobacteraceae bacterium]